MSWGIKIAVLYLAFVGMIITMVMLCMGENTDLESKDYYAKELVYQNKIEAIHNANNLEKSINHQVTSSSIILKIPSDFTENVNGEILFFRPSDANMDFRLPMKFNLKGEQLIDLKYLVNGMYKMQLSWNMNNKNYFKETVINIKK